MAFWPVWRWYVHRLNDQSDEAWGIVALVTAVAFAFWHKRESGSAIAKNEIPVSPQRRGEHRGFAERKRDEEEMRSEEGETRRSGQIPLVSSSPCFLVSPPLRASSAFSAPLRLMLPATLLLCYSALYHFLTPLPRAAIAVPAIAATVSAIRFGRASAA